MGDTNKVSDNRDDISGMCISFVSLFLGTFVNINFDNKDFGHSLKLILTNQICNAVL